MVGCPPKQTSKDVSNSEALNIKSCSIDFPVLLWDKKCEPQTFGHVDKRNAVMSVKKMFMFVHFRIGEFWRRRVWENNPYEYTCIIPLCIYIYMCMYIYIYMSPFLWRDPCMTISWSWPTKSYDAIQQWPHRLDLCRLVELFFELWMIGSRPEILNCWMTMNQYRMR